MAVPGLTCCMGFSLVAAGQGYSLVVALRLPTAVASLVAEHRLLGAQASVAVGRRLSSYSSQAL